MDSSLFALIEELQQVHGLRTDDYIRYRRYCSRKLERLRNKFNLHHTPKSQVKVSIELCKTNPEALHLILFKLEWFWAQICQLRNELSRNSRKKHHIRSICRNSFKFIRELTKLSQDFSIEINSNLRLEYLAYVNSFEGIVRNELKEFSLAFNCLQKSKVLIEELIQRKLQVELLERKVSELDTIMRVCQYSADMHDSMIEFDEASLTSFKVNILTDKMSTSEIICDDTNSSAVNLNLGPYTFVSKGGVTLLEKDLKKNLKISRGLLKDNETRDTLLQVAYYENIYFKQEIGHKLIKFAHKGFKSVDFKICLEKLIQAKGHNKVDESFSKVVDLLTNLLVHLFTIQTGTGNILFSVNSAISAIELIENESEMIEKYNFSALIYVLMFKREIRNRLNHEIKGKSRANINVSSAPVPPKPSFYDIVLDSLDYTISEPEISQSKSGISNLLSSFWGSKK